MHSNTHILCITKILWISQKKHMTTLKMVVTRCITLQPIVMHWKLEFSFMIRSNVLQCTPIRPVFYIIIISCIPPDLIEPDWSTLHRIGAHWKELE